MARRRPGAVVAGKRGLAVGRGDELVRSLADRHVASTRPDAGSTIARVASSLFSTSSRAAPRLRGGADDGDEDGDEDRGRLRSFSCAHYMIPVASCRAADLHQDLRRRGPRPLQGVSRQLLARARRGARVSRRVRQGADRRRLSRGADSRGVRRVGPRRHRGVDHPRGDQPQRRQRRRLPRADVHDGHAAAARLRRAEARVPADRSPAARCGCRRSASPSRRPARTRRS